MQTQKVIVTGGTGNIGSAVVSELLANDYVVYILCRSEVSALSAKQLGARVITGNIEQPESWLSWLDEATALIHTACGFNQNMGDIDIKLMKSICRYLSSRNLGITMIYTSGCWTYGESEQAITEQFPKLAIDDFTWMLSSIDYLRSQKCVDLRIVSPTNVVDKNELNVPPVFLWELKRCGHICLPGGVSQSWSVVERENLAELYRLVLELGEPGEEYIGVGEAKFNIVQWLKKTNDVDVLTDRISEWKSIYGNWVEGYALQQYFSSDKAIVELGWQPKAISSLN
ncbi:NAD-dependent epimerase/dehydratase family protein [Pseudoalteromonas sp. T1lg65]|uniref:NAD-dependent epimerase/dehydratase family protein n=1 Tax=Pseudoalteromonas sp. T1lg65 TaxID=2077101 RepID=UPI003F797B32